MKCKAFVQWLGQESSLSSTEQGNIRLSYWHLSYHEEARLRRGGEGGFIPPGTQNCKNCRKMELSSSLYIPAPFFFNRILCICLSQTDDIHQGARSQMLPALIIKGYTSSQFNEMRISLYLSLAFEDI